MEYVQGIRVCGAFKLIIEELIKAEAVCGGAAGAAVAHDSSVGACLDPAWLGVIFLPESKDKGMQHSWGAEAFWESQNVLEHLDFLPVLGPVPSAPWAG